MPAIYRCPLFVILRLLATLSLTIAPPGAVADELLILEPDFEGAPLRRDAPRQPNLSLPKGWA